MAPASSENSAPLMPKWSSYAGQPVDVSRRRSIHIRSLSDDASTLSNKKASLTIDWFLHEGEFRTAVVPLDGVSDVYGQAFNFSAVRTRQTADGNEVLLSPDGLPRRRLPVMNHVQSRFRFHSDRPIRLYALGDASGKPIGHVDDFVYSLEVTGPAGVKFNLKDGLQGNLLSAHRMLSTQEMVFERIVVENQVVTESPPLELTDKDKRSLLVASLLRSHQAGMDEPYRLLGLRSTNNCTSTPLQILDRVVKYSFAGRLGSLLYRLPLRPRLYLRIRGLDSNPRIRRLVRNEFADYIDAEQTQTRKREHVERLNRKKRERQQQSNG